MAKKKDKNQKHIDRDQQQTVEGSPKKINISDVFLDELKGAFTNFDKLPEIKREELYGNKKYLEQFWEYFKKEYPNLLDKMDKNDLPIYIQALENKWFTLKNINENTSKLHEEFKPEDTEEHVMYKSLEDFKIFCEDSTNNLPAHIFNDFAAFAGFDPNSFEISADGKLKTIDDLYIVRKKFIEKEKITIGETSANHAERILNPDYNPIERMMITVAITKIRKLLKGPLKDAFDEQFPLPITLFSSCQDLIHFKNERSQFLLDHVSEIDESLAKKLDSIIVTNGDIQNELLKTGRKFDDTKWFSEREWYFRRIFNKLVTRQLFEEVQATEKTIDHYFESMANTFKEFPPYVNEIFKIYPFNDKEILAVDTNFHADLDQIDIQILDLQNTYKDTIDVSKKETIRKQIRKLKEERELCRWQAYVAFLKTKDAALADVFALLVENRFDFSVLSSVQQQSLIDTLLKHKLEDTIKNKVPELISVTEEDLTAFVNDLFDLQKMDLIIPTRHWPIPLHFLKKAFMATARKELPWIEDLEHIKNLPLNFQTQLTAANEKFFEESPMFESLYYNFQSKNWLVRINDAYKVRLTKDGKTVEWYLSSYSPLDEKNTEETDGKELYLYSEPITAPHQSRTLVTREGTRDGTPIIIKDNEQQSYDIQILDKQLNLNGEALGALLFGYALGQESMTISMSPEREKMLGAKFGKLDVFKEKEEEAEEEVTTPTESPEKTAESSEKTKFLNERKQLAGYTFPEEQYKENFWFVKGTRLFIPFAESEVPPPNGGKAWLQMEIFDINEKKWTFTLKLHGWELKLWVYESQKKELPISPESFLFLKWIFWDTIYKLPNPKWASFDPQFNALVSSKVAEWFEKVFENIAFDWNKFTFVNGDEKGEKVEYFWRYDPQIGEDHESEPGKRSLYKITHNPDHTFTLRWEFVDNKGKNVIYTRDMDYPTFMIFVKEKELQPKSKKQADVIKKRQDIKDQETPTTRRWFSINNLIGFFKNSISKIKDAIKKYDEERTEDLIDLLTQQWRLYSTLWKILPFARVSAGFETLGAEYFLERDSRIWKKVEKWKKYYEDADFSLVYEKYIKPMIKGQITIKPHYKAAAMLLAMINKGKWPYNRNPEFAAKGMRVNILMWPEHQQRYLNMRAKLIRELQQWASVYGSIWADNKKNEILELEMKYIVHVMDARQLGIQDGDKTKYYFYGKYSKQFIDELEGSYTKFFSQSTVEEWVGKVKSASFDFARAEFFRLLWDRPQQAVPFLKVMAMKATSPSQWRTFEMAVMAGMLSGVFLTMTMSETQWMIKSICRTRWFVPGIWVKDIHQQTKLQRMLDIFSNWWFSSSTKYDASKFSFENLAWGTKDFTKRDANKPWVFQKWISSGNTLHDLSEFFKLMWKNTNGKTLLDIYADPKTSIADKELIKEFLNNSNEKYESLDNDVRNNPYALTGSILTKSQSAVHQMLKIDQTWFAGKDGDEIQTMKWFFKDMADAIPQGKVNSKEEVKFFIDKFFNRFDEKWFSGNNVTIFIKRLKRCQQNPWKKEIDDVLYYSVVWQVLESLGRGTVPPELEKALVAWKEFFKHNLDTVLQSDVLVNNFWGMAYKQDYDRAQPKLEPWETCINLLDRDLKQTFFYSLTGEQRKEWNRKLQYLKSDKNYLNAPLYELAEKIERNFSISNRFKTAVDIDTAKNTAKKGKSTPPKVTWAKIKNPEVIDKVKKILEGKPLDEIPSDDEYIPMYEDDSFYYN